MAEYIERAAIIDLIDNEGYDGEYDLGYRRHNNEFKELVMEIPAADVAPVRRGRWVNPRPESEMCSQCGARFYISALFAVGGNDEPPYCPNCGAMMNEEEESNGG